MSMIEILFNMNTEQSVDAGHHTGLLERTGGEGAGSVAELLCFVGVYWITGRLLNEIRSWLVPYCVGVEAGEIPVFYVRGLPGKSWPESSVWLREAWMNIDWELDSSALGSMVSVPCPLISWGITVSTIQSRASRTITSSYFLWVDLLLVDIIIFSCVGYLLSVCCECALLLVEILAISLSLCACECAWLTDQREQLWCGGGCWRTLLADFGYGGLLDIVDCGSFGSGLRPDSYGLVLYLYFSACNKLYIFVSETKSGWICSAAPTKQRT